MIRIGIVAASKRRSTVGASLDVRALKHYVIAKVPDGGVVRSAKHYVIAKSV